MIFRTIFHTTQILTHALWAKKARNWVKSHYFEVDKNENMIAYNDVKITRNKYLDMFNILKQNMWP